MAFSASAVTVAFIIVNLSSSVPVRDYASHAGICTGRLAVHLRSARNRMVLAFYPALSVVEWWAVLGCWVIWHCWSSFRAPGRPTWAYPTQACFRPAEYRSAIRRGGTFVGDGTLGTRWSGLVERKTQHSLLPPGAAKLNTLRALPMKASVGTARMY